MHYLSLSLSLLCFCRSGARIFFCALARKKKQKTSSKNDFLNDFFNNNKN